ncbi:protein serine phosphatase [Amycolatopsis antarctica]|uniref:Protein serine phosphatase n=1 Tax=Amycolatopsis antarctica TaxID=1854586 RepID=A0A263D3A1_9PSEU|nr:GAF domain-containing SpoIIE family protein phosphatase [Amycolatopsis antarctica]OZM71835.1 protein serine phosphatase [Amycolatopsis antarctica]
MSPHPPGPGATGSPRTDQAHDDPLRAAFVRMQRLLVASEALSEAESVTDIRSLITELATGELAPPHVELLITQDRGVQGTIEDQRSQAGPAGEGVGAAPVRVRGQWADFDPASPLPPAQAVRERALVHYPDRADMAIRLAPEAVRHYDELGLHAVVCAPVISGEEVFGVLEFGWHEPYFAGYEERMVITMIASYTARALERVRFVQHRISVSAALQQAMLTRLPSVEGLRMAAHYRPAGAEDQVGGDWYDAIPLPVPTLAGGATLAVTVGDVTGHDIHAAAMMGQARAMLRQAEWDHPGRSPAGILSALEQACEGLGTDLTGTAVVMHLAPRIDGGWAMEWSNAGHPPPIRLGADGTAAVLGEHDLMLGCRPMFVENRTTARAILAPGDTVLLYTDGLVERRGEDVEQGIDALRELARTHAGVPVRELVDTVVHELAGPAPDDDVVLLAVHVP